MPGFVPVFGFWVFFWARGHSPEENWGTKRRINGFEIADAANVLYTMSFLLKSDPC